VAVSGLLVLAGCMVLLGVLLKVKGLQDSANVAQILSIVLAVPALVTFLWRQGTTVTAPTADQIRQARETLAGLVSEQWRHEALARSLGDPLPMSVQWRLTEHAVMDHPRIIMAGQLVFTGRSDRIGPLAEKFRRLRRRRLVILGGPGSGKTTLAVQLLLELLATPRAGDPIPVLLSLARWDTTTHPQLHSWLAERLAEDYPSLRGFGVNVARALAAQGHILPILDGLDELLPGRQPDVITALNASLTETDQLILTSRTREYETAVAQVHNLLNAAAVIEAEPLTSGQAADYLEACLPPDPGPSWRGMLDRLRAGTAEHLATVVATPLGLWLLRTVYITPRTDPTPLLNSEVARDAATMQAHLFDQLIPATLTTRPAARNTNEIFRPRRTWDAIKVSSSLTYLAHHLDETETRDLLWWHLARHTFTPRAFRLVVRLVIGLIVGLIVGLGIGLAGGPVAGLAAGLGAGLGGAGLAGVESKNGLTNEPAYANLQLKHRTGILVRNLMVGLGSGMVLFGLLAGLWLHLAGLLVMLATGLVFGLVAGLVRWVGTPSKTGWASTPRSTYKATRALAVMQVSIGGLVGGLGFGLVVGLGLGPVNVLGAVLCIGLWLGLEAMCSSAWFSYILTSCRLAAAGKLPLRLIDFLDDAYRLGLLRITGPAYQFRHAEFHDHLIRTSSPAEDQPEPSTRTGE
jgi:hypothetical protein